MPEHDDGLATRGDVVVREAAGHEHLAAAVRLLESAEAVADTSLVDESEGYRLRRSVEGGEAADPRWHPLLAWADDRPVGYGAVVLAPAATSVGDVAVDRRAHGSPTDVLRALLAAIAELAESRQAARRLQIWTRAAGAPEVEAAAAEGFTLERRLAVMGRSLDDVVPAAVEATAHVRAYVPGQDDDAVAAVLAGAYAGTDDAGWDLETFRARTQLPWFRAEDLLVAELDDLGIAGLHWLKRRGPGQGEVYNLAVHPDAQGRGLGPILLQAGLAHLRDIGCDEVLLWVDLANERAVQLYRGQGFLTRWEDLALGRHDT